MAREIKDTPVLMGADAKRFETAIKENESKRVLIADYYRAVDTYHRIHRESK